MRESRREAIGSDVPWGLTSAPEPTQMRAKRSRRCSQSPTGGSMRSAASGSAPSSTRYPLLDNLARGGGRRVRPHVWSTVMLAGESCV
jgi:hypothetical protein